MVSSDTTSYGLGSMNTRALVAAVSHSSIRRRRSARERCHGCDRAAWETKSGAVAEADINRRSRP
jgi:hypothetical protein